MTRAERPSTPIGPVAALAIVLAVVQATVLFGLRPAETRVLFDPAVVAPSLPLYGDQTLSQTFVPHVDGLTAITVYPTARERPVAGTVELTLEREPEAPVARATVPAADVFAGPEWTWTFAPVEASARRPFRLRVAVPQAIERHGLSLAIGPPTYADGTLYIGVRPQWGDLQFQTHSQYSRVVDLLRRRPSVQRGPWVLAAAGAALIVLATGLSALTVALIRDRARE